MKKLAKKIKKPKKQLSSFQSIALGFIVAIFLGACLLSLPISSKSHEYTPFVDSLFTATSALCVTGLVVRDTASYWSSFGHGIIITMIQIGGLGVMTIALFFISLATKRITLRQRSSLQDTFSVAEINNVPSLLKLVFTYTFTVEFIGGLLLLPAFCRDFGAKGIIYSFFHSVSAFCNAGFDLLGTVEEPFQSVTSYASDPLVNIVLMLLILLGGIGFLTVSDIKQNKFHVKKWKVQTKLILIALPILVFLPAIMFFFVDFKDLPMGERILCSLFQSVTTRTAGFNTADLTQMSGASQSIMTVLMLIGASSVSTAGGLKVTTIFIVILGAMSSFKRQKTTVVFGKSISDETVKTANAVVSFYIILFLVGGIAISLIENLPVGACFFESASAIATVGITLGITPTFSLASKIIIIVYMFLGRVGGLTIFYATFAHKKDIFKFPNEGVVIG